MYYNSVTIAVTETGRARSEGARVRTLPLQPRARGDLVPRGQLLRLAAGLGLGAAQFGSQVARLQL